MMMELDLDSILHSHAHTFSDDDDDDDRFIPHRTVDEILLNHSSSSSASPSPPPSPSTSVRRQEQSDGTSVSPSSEALRLTHSHSLSSELNPSTSIITRIKSDDFSSLPPFLSGVIRSNAKPGAALAAAAAASRSIPTPHAAAIRRASSSSATVRKVFKHGQDLASSAANDAEVASSSSAGAVEGLVATEDIFTPEIDGSSNILDNFQSPKLQRTDQADSSGELSLPDITQESLSGTSGVLAKADADNDDDLVSKIGNSGQSSSTTPVETSIDSAIRSERCFDVDGNSVQSELLERKYDNGQHLPANEDNTVYAETITTVEDILPSSVSGCEVSFDKEISPTVPEMELENVVPDTGNHEVLSGGEDNSSKNEAADILEEQVMQEDDKRDSMKTGKKSLPSLRPIELAEELEKKQTFAGMHWEEGAAAQPMRLEGVRRGSTALGYFDISAENTLTHNFSTPTFRQDHGSPQVLTVHLNYIAVGMSKGLVIIVPSRYTPHQVDNMDAKMLMLSLHGERAHIPVTSLCFNHQGDLLFAGYGDGQYVVWDVQRASAAKVVTEHKAPVVHLFFLGQDSRQFNVISGDSKGIVKLIRFSIVPWLNRISFSKSMKLLDETTSTVVCASPLLSGDSLGTALTPSLDSNSVSGGSVGSMMGGMVGGDTGWKLFDGSSLSEEGVVVFVTHQSALVAKVSPNVEVYAQLPRPDGVREGCMPYAAWKCVPGMHNSSNDVPVESSHKVSLLAIAWDHKIQVAKLVKSDLKVLWEWTLDNSAVGVAWLDDQMLVILTSTGQLCLFEKDGNLIHQTSFSTDGPRGDDLISYHTYFSNAHGNPEKAHHNCIAVRGANVYILGTLQLVVSRLLPWKERIEVLRKAGDWMGALNMAMTLYDGQAHGVIDLPRNLSDVQKTVMPYLVELLLSYVEEVFSYLSVAFSNQSGKLCHSDESNDNETKEQYARVGGVAVEFCLHINRTDVLFDEIWKRFDNEKQQDTFLELLEPYILKDMLGSLPPEIMQVLVEHYSNKGWLQRVEQCVLHMDISSLDFNQVVRICREHMLYGALIYLFNKGLGDFKAPLEELFSIIRNSKGETAAPFGYKMLVYLKYCFQGLAFPPGHGTLSTKILPSLRKELVQFLLEDSCLPNSLAISSFPANGPHSNLLYLLQLDTEATLDILQYAFVEDVPQLNHISDDSTNSDTESAEVNGLSDSQNLVQELVDVLAAILDASFFQSSNSCSSDDDRSIDIWPSKRERDHILDFIAYYVSCERAKVSKSTLSQILEYLTSETDSSHNASENDETSKRRQKQLVTLLEVLPEHEWDAPYLLHLCEKAQFHQVCGLIHSIRHQYLAALDSYIKDVDEPIHAFSFIHDMLQQLGNKDSDAFRSAVISRIPDLAKLSREETFFMVISHFGEKFQHILSELRSHPKSLFLYLKTLIEVQSSGSLKFSSMRNENVLEFPSLRKGMHQSLKIQAYLESLSKFPKVMQNYPVHVTDEMMELYLELLCQYERNSVCKFLESLESYRVEHCLRLCLEHGITDAAAFLYERVGDVGSALSLLLSTLNDKFILLDASIEKELCGARLKHFNNLLETKEVNDILEMVHCSISLCQRNSPRLDPYESECLWFELLDSFCEPLIDSFNDKVEYEGDKSVGISVNSMGNLKDEGACRIKWKVSKSHQNAEVLRRLLSFFIKEIVEGMIGYVRLPTIMLKLLSENGSQEFGDFKLTIMGMLGTYDFERRILDTAKALIEDDTYYTMSLLKRGASHGYAPRSLTCCVCNCLLSRSSSIQIFSCGHAMHLHCELPENGTSSKGSSVGCPICMPRKNSQRSRSKSMSSENGLVSKTSKSQQGHGPANALHLHDNDFLDISFGHHPVSRFELLSNLQKEQRPAHVEQMPKLRLAPPALYHEKVNKRIEFQTGESSSKVEKPSRNRQLRDIKVKGSAIRFPLKSNIFGKEKIVKR
ncbi:vacuolar protein sorting-associated protein 8 homolog isoform X2 [Ipomoea triloba]|uniref:vacuolar protein sorting-associated protein 8 homolog isoform X2 n=1 Tax=Ipomoea triloba TaxID=35885 RepID=UPI00125E185F|nr:vacuolar protein sorting-associated protein 8 homolog isoform X2 [Ipomoea triloba]